MSVDEKNPAEAADPHSFHAIASDTSRSPLEKYQLVHVGLPGIWPLLRYELLMLFVNDLPGLAGIWLRSKLYRSLFGRLGRRVVLGRGLALRQPAKVSIDEGSVVDDWCMFKVRGGEESRIAVGKGVFLGRYSSLNARGGEIHVLDHANIGSHVRIGTRGRLQIGRHCIIAAFCYIGGTDHRSDRTDVPMILQGMDSKGGVTIEDDVWIGAGAIVNDGVRIGRGAIVGAGAVVTHDIPSYAVAVGIPARVIRDRRDGKSGAAPAPPAAGAP